MIKLFVADNDVSNGSIAISWCVSHETLDLLAKNKIMDPQIIVCVSPEGDEYNRRREYRKVVPLKDLMTYVEFHTPGKNRICAFITHKSRKDAKNKYLLKDDGCYDSDILTHDGNDYANCLHALLDHNEKDLVISEPITVNVPQECFAPEPSAWEKLWVNHFFRNRPIDQCNYRRRRMFAYTIQPIIFTLFALAKIFFLFGATLIGSRNWSLKYLLHPLTYDVGDSLEVFKGGTIFVSKLWTLPLMPAIFIPIALLIYFHVLWIVIMALVCIVMVILLFYLVDSGLIKKAISWCVNKLENLFSDKDYLWYLDQEEMNMIACDNRKKITKLADLPSKKRTIALRFANLKSKVCRPFSA